MSLLVAQPGQFPRPANLAHGIGSQPRPGGKKGLLHGWPVLLVAGLSVVLHQATGSFDIIAAAWVRATTWGALLYMSWLCFKPKFDLGGLFFFFFGVTYASWPFFVLLTVGLTPDRAAAVVVVSEFQKGGMVPANDLLFIFGALVLFSFHTVKGAFLPPDRPEIGRAVLLRAGAGRMAWIIFLVGTLSNIVSKFVPKVLQQITTLIGLSSDIAFLLAVVGLDMRLREGRRGSAWLMYVLLMIGCAGVSGFLLAGRKGAIVGPILLIIAFGLFQGGSRFKKLSIGAVLMLLALVPALPILNVWKETISVSSEGANALVAGSASSRAIDRLAGQSDLYDYVTIYLVVRVNLTSMTAIYANEYANYSLGWESLKPLVWAFVPRFLSTNKVDMAFHYNEIARMSGVGNMDDADTFRRPFLMEEAYYTFSTAGVVVFAVLYGAGLGALQILITKIAGGSHVLASVVAGACQGIAVGPLLGDMVAWLEFKIPAILLFTWFMLRQIRGEMGGARDRPPAAEAGRRSWPPPGPAAPRV